VPPGESAFETRSRGRRYTRDCLGAQVLGHLLNILMMARLERRTEILRMQIADQRNPPVPERQAVIKQSERRMRIMLLARTMR
jgi:hypothetical protein